MKITFAFIIGCSLSFDARAADPLIGADQLVSGKTVSGQKVPIKVDTDGTVRIAGTLSSAGAADTVGNSATFNANNVCATVLLAGQLGAGWFLGAGTADATFTPSLSENAIPVSPGCTGGNWTESAFVDTSGNSSSTIITTNPNAFQQYGIKTLAGSRCARVCTTVHNGGSATGLLIATTVPSPPPAAGADVTDRVGRQLGIVASITSPVAVTASSLPLPTGAATETGHLAAIDTSTARIPAQGQALAAGSVPVVLTAAQQAALTPPAAITGYTLEAGHVSAIDTSTAKIPAQGQALAANSMPVVLPATQITTLTPPPAISGFALEAGHLSSIDTKVPALGQALEAASVPVVLTAAQQAALTPPAAISGFALEAGHLAAIDTSTAKTPSQGQAVSAASMPVVLPATQITTLTPPAAITGFALEAGHLSSLDAKAPALGQALAAASIPVVLTAIQQAALTPPAAISGFALEAGHLASIDTSTAKIPAQGQALASASLPVVLPATQITTLTPPAAITGFALEAGHLANLDAKDFATSGKQDTGNASSASIDARVAAVTSTLGSQVPPTKSIQVSGQDTSGAVTTPLTRPSGASIVFISNGINGLLPQCNAVRRNWCR